MKTVFCLALLLTTTTAAFAGETLSCIRGTLGQDNYLKVAVGNGRMSFTPHESLIKISPAQVKQQGDSYAVLGETVAVTEEGEESTKKIDALVVYDRQAKKVNVTLLVDGKVYAAGEEVSCRTIITLDNATPISSRSEQSGE